MHGRYVALALLWLSPTLAAAQSDTIHGTAIVNDGDSITIDGKRLRLEGIDAPELAQQCYRNRQPDNCGLLAKGALQVMIRNQRISCDITRKDRYDRYLAHCYLGEININARMVETGHALAYRRYSDRYVLQEERARAAKVNIHSAKYTYPWDWRKKNPRSR